MKVMLYFTRPDRLVHLSTFLWSEECRNYQEHQSVSVDHPNDTWYYANAEDIAFQKSKWERHQKTGSVVILDSMEAALDYASSEGWSITTKRLLELL